MFNQVILTGRLAKNPIPVQIDGYKKCIITLAVTRPFREKETGEYKADYIDVHCWNFQADAMLNNCKKGSVVMVKGRIESSIYENKKGETVFSNVVVAEKILFLAKNVDVVNQENYQEKEEKTSIE